MDDPLNALGALDDFGAGRLGSFTWDSGRDAWSWSDEEFRLYGYRPSEVAPTFDLALRHKEADGRTRAERAMGRASEPGFRFSNHHRITDVAGRVREVVSVGSTELSTAADGRTRPMLRGFMVDVTRQHAAVAPALDEGVERLRRLSAREREVLALVARGRTNDEIAAHLFVSVNTVKTYVRTAYRKIGVTRRSQAVIWALAHLVPLADPPPGDRLL